MGNDRWWFIIFEACGSRADRVGKLESTEKRPLGCALLRGNFKLQKCTKYTRCVREYGKCGKYSTRYNIRWME